MHLLEGYVEQLQGYRQRTLADVRGDVGLAWAIEHGLQLVIQCVIDVCHYLVAGLALGTPATSQDAIALLRDTGVFPAAFAHTLVHMARFRNILVHLYAQVDVNPPLGDGPSRPRLSIAFFNHPNYDVLIECLAPPGEAKHAPVLSGEYRNLKYTKTGLAPAR